MAFRHRYQNALAPERSTPEVGVLSLADHNHYIEQAVFNAFQQHLPVTLETTQLDSGIEVAKPDQRRAQIASGKGSVEANRQPSDLPRSRVANPGIQLFELLHDASSSPKVGFPVRRQPRPTGAAIEHCDAEALLDVKDMSAKGCLFNVQIAGSAAEAASLRSSDDMPELT